MTRKECLDKAAECVLKDRQNVYGKPEDCFGMIARMWGAYLGACVSAHDVAAMMALLKIARFRHNPLHEDNAVDCAGYAACMVETATAWEREQTEEQEPQNGDEVVVIWKHKPEAEGNYPENPDSSKRAEGCEEPAYNPDNDVVGGVVTLEWPRGKLLEKRYASGRNEKCAEGCEALVEKDAPQTPQELYQHIVDCNPATFHTPSYAEEQLEHRSRLQAHKPTGEELAEMAEEERA